MGVSAAIFESAGQRTEHYVPGAYSRSYNVTSPSGVISGNLCLLGKSTGGKPDTLLEFGSVADATETLVSGELLDAVKLAFTGSNTYVPQKVYAMRVNDGTQASLKLANGSTDLLSLTSWDYGIHTNQLKLMISTGTTNGSKKLNVVYKNNSTEIDNILRASINLTYGGSGENPVVTITEKQIKLSSSDSDDTVELNFEDYPTISELVTKINDSDSFIAQVLDTNSEALSAELDTCSSVTIGTETATVLYSNFAAFIDALETVTYIGGIEKLTTATRTTPENTNAYVYFTGGSAGSYTVAQWTTALEELETKDIQIISTLSADSDVHTLIANHCTQMCSTTNRKERTCILGGAIGETDESAIAKAVSFNNKLVSYVVDNPIISGTVYSGATLAVMLAGIEAAVSVQIPLTRKVLNVAGFNKVRTITNLEKLIKNGVMVCNPNPDNVTEFICIRAVTTYQGSDLIYNERSMVREDLYMNRDLRNYYTPMIGNPNSYSISEIISVLNDAAAEWKRNGYIVSDDSNKNVWNVKVKVSGDKIYLTYSRYLTAPTNFVFITAVNHVYETTQEM